MRVVAGIALALLSATLAHGQSKRALLCSEDVAMRLKAQTAVDGSLVEAIPARRFSFVWNDEFLNVISAGKTDFYECSNIKPRLNEGGPRNSIKCQNGIYFIAMDVAKLTFIRATLNPQSRADVEVAYGACKTIGS
ncbi:hypothetical protein [Methylobacterium haplocladii]|uniref:Uncharacterized protein n=1 Tax=Methylobacterium haplocladii TaxID=1176176 RepID=A0A512IQN7_9HYPH|nr:hypothetical protein [Methylobacterium haplocladii]GEP00034.1 hypothetical protein MHA02_24210 [Methylobacterium haplocladii]GLS59864.1 hypothetical protein GCM10007887_25370 [Methylobacterium haplocladii]